MRRLRGIIAHIQLLSLCHRVSTFASAGPLCSPGALTCGGARIGSCTAVRRWLSVPPPPGSAAPGRIGGLRGGTDGARGGGSTGMSCSSGASSEPCEEERGRLPGGLSLYERLMGDTHREHRSLCEVCKRPPRVCICSALPEKMPLDIKTRVIILQHPREFRRKTIGTVPLVKLLLSKGHGDGDEADSGGGCDVITCPYAGRDMGEYFGEHPRVVSALESGHAQLLFPALHPCDPLDSLIDSKVTNLDDEENAPEWEGKEAGTLIVIDGSWSQAKAIFKQAKRLHSVPRVQFGHGGLGEYGQLRSEPRGNYMSTLESVAHSLRILEGGDTGPRVCDALIAVQRELVRHQRKDEHMAKRRAFTRPRSERVKNKHTNPC